MFFVMTEIAQYNRKIQEGNKIRTYVNLVLSVQIYIINTHTHTHTHAHTHTHTHTHT